MSSEGQNVYPVDKLCAGWACCILRELMPVRQHLVSPVSRCDQGNTLQVVGDERYKSFASGLSACDL